jgi:hypothetical protein
MPESKPGKPLDTKAAKKDEQKEQQRKEAEEKEHLDEELDEALEMTFPASDPIAVSRPEPPLKKEEEPPRQDGPQQDEQDQRQLSPVSRDPGAPCRVGGRGGAACVTRTRDPIITNDVLYRLS